MEENILVRKKKTVANGFSELIEKRRAWSFIPPTKIFHILLDSKIANFHTFNFFSHAFGSSVIMYFVKTFTKLMIKLK